MMRNGVLLGVAVLLLSFSGLSAQELTAFAPAEAIEGEDPAILQMLYERWSKQAKPYKVAGQVTDAEGKPVANAKLTYCPDMGVRLVGKADGEGRFAIAHTATMIQNLLAESEDGKLAGVATHNDGDAPPKLSLKPVREVKLTVTDADGAAVADANCGACINLTVVARGRTDAKGVITLRMPELPPTEGPRPVMHFQAVYAFAGEKGMAVETWRDAAEGDDSSHVPTKLELKKPSPVKAKVVDRDGKAIEGLPFFLFTYYVAIVQSRAPAGGAFGGRALSMGRHPLPLIYDPRAFLKSDENGEVTVSWLAPSNEAETERMIGFSDPQRHSVVFETIHPEWGPEYISYNLDSPPPELVCTVYSPSRIHGRAVLPGGAPAAGVKLRFNGHNPIYGATPGVETNEKGEFEFEATIGAGSLVIDDSRWVSTPIDLAELVRKSADQELNIELREGRKAKFRLTAGPEFKPLAKHQITITRSGLTTTLATDGEGRAEAALDRGVYSVAPVLEEESMLLPGAAPRVTLLVKDQKEIEVPIHVDVAPPRTIKVTVHQPDDASPAAKATVTLLNYAMTPQGGLEAGAFGGRAGRGGGIAPAGLGGAPGARPGFGGGGGFGGAGGFGGFPAGPDGRALGREPVMATTNDRGEVEMRAPLAAAALLLVNGANGERGFGSVDVLENETTIALRPTITIKGRLLNETTGEVMSNVEVRASLDLAKLKGGGADRIARSLPTGLNLSALDIRGETDEEGMFELSGLFAETPYQFGFGVSRSPIVFSGFGSGDSDRNEMLRAISSLRKRTITEFQSAKGGVQDIGELKVAVPATATPQRRAIPGDPNAPGAR